MRFVTLLLLSLLAACTPARERDPDPVPGTDAGTDAGLPDNRPTCANDTDCESFGLVCDEGIGRCICTDHSMCSGVAPFCLRSAGRCSRDECAVASDCSGDTFCDVATKRCLAKPTFCEACTSHDQCAGSASLCVAHPDFPGSSTFCATACVGGCAPGSECRDLAGGRVCVRTNATCDAAPDCTPDTHQTCGVDADCTQGSGQFCDRFLRRCIAAEVGCDLGQICDPGSLSCVGGCVSDTSCAQETEGARPVCSRGRCVASTACAGDGTCPLGQRCQTGTCVGGCAGDTDCPLHAVCEGGACEYAGANGNTRCQTTIACSFRETCTARSCLAQPDHCKSCVGGCGTGACTTIYAKVQCGTPACPAGVTPVCQFDASCGGNLCGCPIQRCVSRCVITADCPQGFSCERISVNGNSGPWCHPVDGSLCL